MFNSSMMRLVEDPRAATALAQVTRSRYCNCAYHEALGTGDFMCLDQLRVGRVKLSGLPKYKSNDNAIHNLRSIQ